MVELEPVRDQADQALLRGMIERHAQYAGSAKAKKVLEQWKVMLPKFVRVMPVEYKKVMEQRKAQRAASKEAAVHG
jgi:glutamate synthase domain-containing protein 3